jgi:hypothetical protein
MANANEYVPAGQATHCSLPLSKYCPATQVTTQALASVEPTGDVYPANGQGVHVSMLLAPA